MADRRVGLGAVAGAFVRRDLAVLASYKLSFAIRIGSLLVTLTAFAFLARFVASGSGFGGRYGGAGYLGFWLVGLAVGELFRALSTALARRIREAQLEGTLEATLSTPAPAAYVVLSAPLAEIALSAVSLALVFAAGVVIYDVRLGPIGVPALVATAALSIVAFAALGVVAGALTMFLRRTDPISFACGAAALLVGGVLYPTSVLPAGVREAAYAFPLAPSLEATRRALFARASISEIAGELTALALFIAIVAPIGVWMFSRALAAARRDGSLGLY